MKFRPFALLAFVAATGLIACSEDPTEAGDGQPLAIITNRSETTLARNAQFTIVAYTIDQNNRRIPGQLSATPAGSAVAVDSVRYVPELIETRVFIRGVSASSAGTDVTITGHNLTATTKVIVQ